MPNKSKTVQAVTRLKNRGFKDFLDDLTRAYNEGRLTDAFCMFRFRNEGPGKIEARPDMITGYRSCWFGETSCIPTLGLLELMKQDVLEHMKDNNE